jgi:hypothetical protein
MISHCLDSWFTDGCEVVSLTRRPPFYSLEIFVFLSVALISLTRSVISELSAAGKIR